MPGSLNDAGADKPADSRETRRFQLQGLLAGEDAPTGVERRHLLDRASILILARVLADEPRFWDDVTSLRDALERVDLNEPGAETALTNPSWVRTRSYGVQSKEHRTVLTVVLLTAAREPTKAGGREAFWRLGEGLIPLDDESRSYARKDVTRLMVGARMIADYRAGRCGWPECRRDRQRGRGRYCRSHAARSSEHRAHEEARRWALDEAHGALTRQRESPRDDVDYALWAFIPRG